MPARTHPGHSECCGEPGRFALRSQIPRRCAARYDIRGRWKGHLLPVITLLVAAPTGVTQEDPTVLKPDWDRTFERGIEWCAPVGREPATGLLACTKDARLDLIDLGTGQSRLARPIPLQPGTQFAGQTGSVAYCYGRSQVYAFLVESGERATAQQPGLLWQVAAAPRDDTAGDPEFLTRIVGAQATPKGVLVVRSDGQVAELLQQDASVPWRHGLPRITHCALHVRDKLAAVIWKQGEAFRVMFYDLRYDPVRPVLATIDQPPPLWTELIDDALVAVWPKRFAVIAMDAEPRFAEMHPGISATARTVAVYVSQAGTTQPAGASALLLAENADGFACAYDFAAGEWDCPERDPVLRVTRFAPLRSLWVTSDYLFRTCVGWVGVYDAATRDCLSALRRGGASVVGAATHDGFAYGLFCECRLPGDARQMMEEAGIDDEGGYQALTRRNSPPGGPWPIRLVRQIMIGKPWPRPNQPPTRKSRSFDLGDAGPIRDTFWLGGGLVVVEEKRVRAYTLP